MDSLVVASQMMGDIQVWFGLGTGLGLTGIIGKIVWQFLSSTKKTCGYHDKLHTDIIETKTKVSMIYDHLLGSKE